MSVFLRLQCEQTTCTRGETRKHTLRQKDATFLGTCNTLIY